MKRSDRRTGLRQGKAGRGGGGTGREGKREGKGNREEKENDRKERGKREMVRQTHNGLFIYFGVLQTRASTIIITEEKV